VRIFQVSLAVNGFNALRQKRLTTRFCCLPFIILRIELLSEIVYCASAAISSMLSALFLV
jgi:hypothetical protein